MKTLITMAMTLLILAGFSAPEVAAQDRMGYVMRVEGRLVFIDLGISYPHKTVATCFNDNFADIIDQILTSSSVNNCMVTII